MSADGAHADGGGAAAAEEEGSAKSTEDEVDDAAAAERAERAMAVKHTMVGTPGYMAPEIILCAEKGAGGYSFPCDVCVSRAAQQTSSRALVV